ncbi:hypothetical protein [Sinimarinibacterium thermocellulolyticum]|uniref:Uncharacterized protein n=1 Tax=Sinimarinibacterium thermocellulolyticum TaxID=3170016 RepID=A0ABV2A6Y2_9GAMM
MNILRILLLVAAAWLVWRIVRQIRAQLRQQPPVSNEFEPMARCAACGTHLPARSLDATGRCGRCSE